MGSGGLREAVAGLREVVDWLRQAVDSLRQAVKDRETTRNFPIWAKSRPLVSQAAIERGRLTADKLAACDTSRHSFYSHPT